MLDIYFTNQFKKDYRKLDKTKDIALLDDVIDMLRKEIQLPRKFKDHALVDSKKYKGMRECHVSPDWLLIYRKEKTNMILILVRSGSHSELF